MDDNSSQKPSFDDTQETKKVLRRMAIAATATIVFLLLGLVVVSSLLTSSPDESLNIDFSKKSSDEPVLNIPDFEWPSKPVLVSFWASWCGPCVEELPDLQKFASEQSQIQVVLVNIDEKGTEHQERANQMLLKLGHLSFEHVWSTAGVFQTFGGESLPSHFLFSGERQKIWESNGAIPWNNDAIKSQLFSLTEPSSKKARETDKN